MTMRLCVLRGEMRPTLAMQCMTAADVAMYQAWFSQHRFGDDYLHTMLAQLTMVVNNRWRNSNEDARSTKDFIPWYKEPEQTPDEMFAIVRSAKLGNRSKY